MLLPGLNSLREEQEFLASAYGLDSAIHVSQEKEQWLLQQTLSHPIEIESVYADLGRLQASPEDINSQFMPFQAETTVAKSKRPESGVSVAAESWNHLNLEKILTEERRRLHHHLSPLRSPH